MLSVFPVSRLSIAMTEWPSAKKRSARCDPKNPAPPVIRMRTLLFLHYEPTMKTRLAAECTMLSVDQIKCQGNRVPTITAFYVGTPFLASVWLRNLDAIALRVFHLGS